MTERSSPPENQDGRRRLDTPREVLEAFKRGYKRGSQPRSARHGSALPADAELETGTVDDVATATPEEVPAVAGSAGRIVRRAAFVVVLLTATALTLQVQAVQRFLDQSTRRHPDAFYELYFDGPPHREQVGDTGYVVGRVALAAHHIADDAARQPVVTVAADGQTRIAGLDTPRIVGDQRVYVFRRPLPRRAGEWVVTVQIPGTPVRIRHDSRAVVAGDVADR